MSAEGRVVSTKQSQCLLSLRGTGTSHDGGKKSCDKMLMQGQYAVKSQFFFFDFSQSRRLINFQINVKVIVALLHSGRQIKRLPSTFLSASAGQADTMSMAVVQTCLKAAAVTFSLERKSNITNRTERRRAVPPAVYHLWVVRRNYYSTTLKQSCSALLHRIDLVWAFTSNKHVIPEQDGKHANQHTCRHLYEYFTNKERNAQKLRN